MKKALPVLGILCAIAVLFSCGKPTEVNSNASIKGFAQKGPFITGTKLLISELNTSLSETGRNFTGTITDDKGTFDMTVQDLASSFVSISSDGFYFDEVSGQLSASRLVLNAIVDVSSGQSINVNVLTHLETERIKFLVSKGTSFSNAKAQAEKEILSIFNINNTVSGFESLDISKNTEGDAALLAISAILQGTHSVAQLTELLAKISLDIKEDGILNNDLLKSELINEAQLLNLSKVKENITKRYKDLGVTATIGVFEPIVENFKKNSGFVFTKKIEYPKVNNANVLNVLSLTKDTTLTSGISYGINANLPSGTNLKVVFRGVVTAPSGFTFGISSANTGWQVASSVLNLVIIQTNSAINSAGFRPEDGGTSLIEIYENGATVPTRTITIKSTALPTINFDATGKYGKNILTQPYSSTYALGDYSFQLSINDVKGHTVTSEFYYHKDANITFSNAEGWTITTIVDTNVDWRKTTLSVKASKIIADLKINISASGSTTTQGWVDGILQQSMNKKMAW